jgi:hypothetical protein
MVSNNCKSSEKKDGFTHIEEQWKWGNIVQNGCKIGMLTKNNNDALEQKGQWMGWKGGGGGGGHCEGRDMYGIK